MREEARDLLAGDVSLVRCAVSGCPLATPCVVLCGGLYFVAGKLGALWWAVLCGGTVRARFRGGWGSALHRGALLVGGLCVFS